MKVASRDKKKSVTAGNWRPAESPDCGERVFKHRGQMQAKREACQHAIHRGEAE